MAKWQVINSLPITVGWASGFFCTNEAKNLPRLWASLRKAFLTRLSKTFYVTCDNSVLNIQCNILHKIFTCRCNFDPM